MEGIWIRSQDKGLLKYCDEICYGKIYGQDAIFDTYQPNENMLTVLGKYKSEERALQVLDEIQDKINYSRLEDIAYAGVTGVAIHDGVYQMPAE